jgi:hypothetical protein
MARDDGRAHNAMTTIRPLTLEQVDPKLRDMLQPTVDRLGYFGEFFQYAGHAPGVLTGFMQYSGALKGALPDDLNEAIALTVCSHLEFEYERVQHERLSLKLGLEREWIATLVGRSDKAVLTAAQQSVRVLALAVLAGQLDDARAALEGLAAETDEAVAVAALFQVMRFRDVCSIGRLLDMRLPVASIFSGEPLEDTR